MLPALTPEGRLPVGRHEATLDELRERFVDQAPNRERRELIFRALELYIDLVRGYFPDAVLWIDGGFVTHKAEPPKDVDVVIVSDPLPTVDDDQITPLETLQRVTSEYPPRSIEKLQPFGGLIDGFVVSPTIAPALAYWDWEWSRVRDAPDTERKGYVEVRL